MSRGDDQPKKSNLWKWLLGCGCLVVIVGVLGIAGGIWFVASGFTTDPAKSREIATSIVAFDLPEGCQMKFGGNLIGMKMAQFSQVNGEGDLNVFIMSFPKSWGTDRKQMELQMDQQAKQRANRESRTLETREKEVLSIRSEDVEANRMVYVEEGGKKIIQYQIFLETQEKTILIQAEGKEDTFDKDAFDDFIDSIK